MPSFRRPRNAASMGTLFLVIGVVFFAIPYYGGWHVDYAGTTMLVFLGVAMAMMIYVLVAGSSGE